MCRSTSLSVQFAFLIAGTAVIAQGVVAPGARPKPPASAALEDSAKKNDFDGLVHAISENDQEHQYYVQFLSGGGSPNSRCHMMLRDCRIAKLRSYIRVKPETERAAIAEQLFDASIEAYDKGFRQQIAAARGEKVEAAPFQCRHDAVLAMLLLCADFCEPRSVMEKVDYLKTVIARHDQTKVLDARGDVVQIFGLERRPDAAFLKNLYLYLLGIRFPEATIDSEFRIAVSRGGRYALGEVPIVYWDLKSNSISDSPAIHDTCLLFPEFGGMFPEDRDARLEKELRVVVDKYIAKAVPTKN